MCAIEWKWIAQRPHFLEMELEKYYEITVLSPVHVLKKMKEQKNTRLPEHFDEFYLLPYQEKIGALKGISKSLFRNKVRDMNDYDIVWLGSSLFEKYIPEDYRGVVVFDYMDDCVSMQDDPRMKRAYELWKNLSERHPEYESCGGRGSGDDKPCGLPKRFARSRVQSCFAAFKGSKSYGRSTRCGWF